MVETIANERRDTLPFSSITCRFINVKGCLRGNDVYVVAIRVVPRFFVPNIAKG